MRPRALMPNQHTREFLSVLKDVTQIQQRPESPYGNSPDTRVNTRYINSTRETSSGCMINGYKWRMYLWWSLYTLYLHTCWVRVTVGNSDLHCLLVWCLSSTNSLPRSLMLLIHVLMLCLFCALFEVHVDICYKLHNYRGIANRYWWGWWVLQVTRITPGLFISRWKKWPWCYLWR